MANIVVVALVLITFVQYCNAESPMRPDGGKSSHDEFFSDLYRVMSQADGNFVYAPTSLYNVLFVLHSGSRGSARNALKRVLRMKYNSMPQRQLIRSAPSSSNVIYEHTTGIIVDEGVRLNNAIVRLARDLNVLVENAQIGDEATAYEPFAYTTTGTIFDTVYFRGNAQHAHTTHSKTFYLADGRKETCPMMSRVGIYAWREDKYLQATIVEVPFRNATQSLYIILPVKQAGIRRLEERLLNIRIESIADGLMSSSIALTLPKFKILSVVRMNNVLSMMGLRQLFRSNADFSRLFDTSGVHFKIFNQDIDFETHQAIGEKGYVSLPKLKWYASVFHKYVNINHPFVFVLMDKRTRTVILQGRISSCDWRMN